MIEYIIVQAGGKGSRMGNLTLNKPKALVPIDNLPMIFHLFKKYPNKKFIIIGDYKINILSNYLNHFAKVNYVLIDASGHKGTCSGIHQAISIIPNNVKFMLIWSDLILPQEFEIPNNQNNSIGITNEFLTRWKYQEKELIEESGSKFGVAGLFVFKNKAQIIDVPIEGEFVRWLSKKDIKFEVLYLNGTKEFGTISDWEKLPKSKSRPFNRLEVIDNKTIKKISIHQQGDFLALNEIKWYKKIKSTNFDKIPQIYSFSPLIMEYIKGKNLYELNQSSFDLKIQILEDTINSIKELHNIGNEKSDINSFLEAYIFKTFNRLDSIRELVPFFKNETININGNICRNIIFHREKVEEMVKNFFPNEFNLIHGDPTFSNILIDDNNSIFLIDPRGYFGTTELFGDAAYDWAKLYYSIFTNYDQFNLGNFNLIINIEDESAVFERSNSEIEMKPRSVFIDVSSNNWEILEEHFFKLLNAEVTEFQMKLYVALIWLSLTTYTWQDYDSICGAFYNGIKYFEEAYKIYERGDIFEN